MANKIGLSALFIAITTLSAFSQKLPNIFSTVNNDAMMEWVDNRMKNMSTEERIGQLFMPVVYPTTDAKNTAAAVKLVRDCKIGGILFQRGKPQDQVVLTNRLQREADIPLLISADGEWGLSMRLDNTTRFPKNMMLGAITELDLLQQYGEEVGRQCREMGIHINFAPDADVNNNPDNPVIGIRSFGEDPEDVAKKVIAYSRGLEREGVIAVAKHFPGHGNTSADSHLSLPTVDNNIEELNETELLPFKKFVNDGFSGIMVGHLNVPALGTNGNPSSLTRKVTTDLLRKELGFQGLCFTDGLAMKGAIVNKDESICVKAIQAGNDILVGPVDVMGEYNAVCRAVKNGKISMAEIDNHCRRILCYKYILGLDNFEPLRTDSLDERLNTAHADWMNAKLNEAAITVAKNDNSILPFMQLDKKQIAALSLGSRDDNEFHRTLNKYMETDCYNISDNTDDKVQSRIFKELNDYDIIICSVHNNKVRNSEALRLLAKNRDVVMVFFTTPYRCEEFRSAINAATAVVIAYESTDYAEDFAAQSIFGGISAKGSLPVNIPDLFAIGTGFKTEKIRLGFHKPEEVGLDADILDKIKYIVKEGLEEEAYPGCQVLVAKDGNVIYNRSFGYYDYTKKQSVSDKTVYDLASSSKASGTLLAVMKSYDEGNFKLNNKISTFVKGLAHSDKQDIIIKDLLYHQSGLPPTVFFYEMAIDNNSYNGNLYSTRKDANHPLQFDTKTFVNTNFKYNPSLVSTKRKTGFTTEAAQNFYISDTFLKDSIIAGIREAKLGPTGKYVYSCVNFILLKMMVEEQMNMPMDKLLNKFFFKPLGASTTTYNPLKKMDTLRIAPTENDRFVRRQILRGYVHDESAAFQGGVSGNAGLFSSATDLAKIMQLYLNNGTYGGERYLSTKTCKLFTGSKNPASRRGLGFDKPDTKKPQQSPCGLLAPESVYGHTGYTGTCFWIDPENNLFFIFLSNRTYPSRTHKKLFSLDIRTRIQDTIYKSIKENY